MQDLIGSICSLANETAVDQTESLLSSSRSPSTVISPCVGDCSISLFIFGGGEGGGGGVVAQRWKHGVMVFHKNKYQEECDNHKGILLVAYAGKTLLKVIARRISEYCEHVGILPGGPAGGTKWFPTAPLYHRCDVRDSSATRVGVGENSVVCMLYPPYQSVRLR